MVGWNDGYSDGWDGWMFGLTYGSIGRLAGWIYMHLPVKCMAKIGIVAL